MNQRICSSYKVFRKKADIDGTGCICSIGSIRVMGFASYGVSTVLYTLILFYKKLNNHRALKVSLKSDHLSPQSFLKVSETLTGKISAYGKNWDIRIPNLGFRNEIRSTLFK